MNVDDFMANFEAFGISNYHEGWFYTYQSCKSDKNHANYFKFTLDCDAQAYFRIHQKDERHFRQDGEAQAQGYSYSPALFRLCKVN